MADTADAGSDFSLERLLAGLSDSEAASRIARYGFNELPSSKPRSIFRIAFEVIREPMLLLLLACGSTYLLLGDPQEAIILLIFVVVVIAITLYQERKTERALEALRDLSSPRALVVRGGERKRIAGRDVVPGDILVLSEGDRVPADGVLLSAVNLATDESLLTGESVPVRKQAMPDDTEMARPGGDDLPSVFSGTLVVRGTGLALAKATGVQTELGKIGKSLREVEQEPTLVQRDTRHMVRVLALVGLALCGLLIIFYGLTRGDWLRGFLAALTLAMAILPEELPVVLTVFLALGAWRMSRKHVLTRHMPAIEMLGAATALCVDKTGTLTMNRMSVTKLYAKGESYDLSQQTVSAVPEQFHELAEFAMLASQPDPFDPMDRAIRQLGDEALKVRSICMPVGRWFASIRLPRASWQYPRCGFRPIAQSLLSPQKERQKQSQISAICRNKTQRISTTVSLEWLPKGCVFLEWRKRTFPVRPFRINNTISNLTFWGSSPWLTRSGPPFPAHSRMPNGGYPRDHDHRRLSWYRDEHRAPDRT